MVLQEGPETSNLTGLLSILNKAETFEYNEATFPEVFIGADDE
jgi:hypothetical protein